MMKVCCVCDKVLQPDNTWAKQKYDSTHVTHGYCSECVQVQLAQVRAYYDEQRKTKTKLD